MPKPLKTNRLLLRAFTPSDAPALYAYASDPRVGPMAGWKPHESVEESARMIEHFIRTDEVWAIVEQAPNCPSSGIFVSRMPKVEAMF